MPACSGDCVVPTGPFLVRGCRVCFCSHACQPPVLLRFLFLVSDAVPVSPKPGHPGLHPCQELLGCFAQAPSLPIRGSASTSSHVVYCVRHGRRIEQRWRATPAPSQGRCGRHRANHRPSAATPCRSPHRDKLKTLRCVRTFKERTAPRPRDRPARACDRKATDEVGLHCNSGSRPPVRIALLVASRSGGYRRLRI